MTSKSNHQKKLRKPNQQEIESTFRAMEVIIERSMAEQNNANKRDNYSNINIKQVGQGMKITAEPKTKLTDEEKVDVLFDRVRELYALGLIDKTRQLEISLNVATCRIRLLEAEKRIHTLQGDLDDANAHLCDIRVEFDELEIPF